MNGFKIFIRFDKEAEALEKAVQVVLNDGLRTKDILSNGMKEVSTSQMGDAIISNCNNLSIILNSFMPSYTAPVEDMMFL